MATALWRFIYAVWQPVVRFFVETVRGGVSRAMEPLDGKSPGWNIRTVLKFLARGDFGQDRPWPMSALDRTGRHVRIGVCVR